MRARGFIAMARNRANRAAIYSTAEYWDDKAREYDGTPVSMWPNAHLNAYYHREQLSLLRRRLGDVRGKRILDVGCGTGRISRALADSGGQVVGIDFAAKVIDIARSRSPAGNPSYQVRSLFDLEAAQEYDVVVSWGSLAVACKDRSELSDALRRLRRALEPGGAILLVEPIHRGFLHRVLDMDVAEFVAVMAEAGFRVTSVSQLHFWPARLALAFVGWPKPVTAFGYHAGQWLMRHVCRGCAGGDYQCIYATAAGRPLPRPD